MTDARAPAEPYTMDFEARVERVDGADVVLDTTYFYAESGGQPADRGVIDGRAVTDVQHVDGDVVHTLDDEPTFAPGETVAGAVDEAFRTYCMRAHTASHALYGAGRRLLADVGYGGFNIDPEKVRVDFTTPTTIDDAVLLELERLTNRAVWDARDVTWRTMPRDEALDLADIAFNTKTEEGVTDAEEVRVVEIDGWDVAACGGTHVGNTREIGPVTVLERSNPGEGLTRVEFAVGPSAVEARIDEKRAAYDAARAAGTNVEDLPDAVERLRGEVADLEREVADLTDRLAEGQLDELRERTVERDGATWLVGAVDGVDANALGEKAKEMAGADADVVVLVGRDGATFVATAATAGHDASAVVDGITDEFGGGGGGSPDAAQGGGIDADPAEVVSFLR